MANTHRGEPRAGFIISGRADRQLTNLRLCDFPLVLRKQTVSPQV